MSVVKKYFPYKLYIQSLFAIAMLFSVAVVPAANKKAPAAKLPTWEQALKALAKEQANQAAGIVVEKPAKKPVIQTKASDKYTQTEALMSLPFIKDLVKKEYPDYQKYSKIIDAVNNKEKELKNGYYVFYHAYDNQWRVPQDLYKQLYAYYYPLTADIPDSFTFLRFVEQSAPRAQAFLIEEIKKFGLINDNDPHKMLLLSTNLALFGNVGYKNECTWTYFMETHSHEDVNRTIYERILDTYGLTYQYISELTKLEKLLENASKEQTLLQVFIPINRVDEVAYLAWVRGIPAHEKTIDLVLQGIPKKKAQMFKEIKPALDSLGKIYQTEQEKNPAFKDLVESIKKGDFSVNAFLKIYRNTPEKLEDINDFSARLLLSKEYLLQPFSDVKIYQYVTTPSDVLKEYRTRLNDIVSKIIEEKKQRQVTVPPMPIKPLDMKKLEKDFAEVGQVYGQASTDRQELKALRDVYMKEYTQNNMKSNCIQITNKITTATMAYVTKRINETVKKLGPAPTPFSIFTMGSMARDESGFFTDLEIGIIVKEKNPAVISYFNDFNQILADRFFVLGEHPDVGGLGLRIDEGDHAPDHLRFWARYAAPEHAFDLYLKSKPLTTPYEGSRLYVTTPKELANFLDPKFPENMVDLSNKEIRTLFETELAKAQKDTAYKGLSKQELEAKVWVYVNQVARPLTVKEQDLAESITLMRNIRYMYGDKSIFDQYMKLRETYLQGPPKKKSPHYTNRREELAYISLQNDIIRHAKPGSPLITGKLGDEIDLKRTFYRFPEQCLTSLGAWYNVGVQSTAQIADKLVAMGRMSTQWGTAIKDLMNFAMCLRLRKQMAFNKQGFAIPVTMQGYNKLKQQYTKELVTAKAKVLSLQKSKANPKALAKAHEDVSTVDVALRDLEKMMPGKPDSILSPEIITLLNTKYLPLEKKLFDTLKKFLAGDKNAFLGTDIGVAVQAPVATPVKKQAVKAPVVKAPVKKK